MNRDISQRTLGYIGWIVYIELSYFELYYFGLYYFGLYVKNPHRFGNERAFVIQREIKPTA
ncbi:hypothetical protein KD5_11830 [Yersinia pseudotuberculosis]|nr:hypothetical protein YP1_012_00220 [Yersinia pseudotuberculosis NBRC 105692]